MSVKGGPNTVTSGLILELDAANIKSYPRSGVTWFDRSGNNYNAELLNSPGFSTNYLGGIVLDGTDDYASDPFTSPLSETVIVWASSNTTPWNTYGWISSSRKPNGHIIHPESSEFGGKQVTFYVYNSAGTPTSIGSISPSVITIPHMYAFSTNGSNLHKCYLDAALINTSTATISRTTTPTSQTWVLGRDDFAGARFGNGNLYYVARYNRQLSDIEILQNYNSIKGRFGIV